MNKESHLFLVSTPLHLLVSLAIIAEEKLKDVHLVFIDQVRGNTNYYFEVLQRWPTNPFDSMRIFYRPEKNPLKKLCSRKKTFVDLVKVVRGVRPSHIYVGNDRRIEFQWCMHQCSLLGCRPVGYYLDEGTFTYVGRKASFSFSDRIIDNAIKSLFYGRWWKHPATVGASDWVDVVYASYPDIVHDLLKTKEVRGLTLNYWQSLLLLEYCSALLDRIEPSMMLGGYDVVVTLPHESVIANNNHYKVDMHNKLAEFLEAGCQVAVKYHPRDVQLDALSVAQLAGVTLLPAAVPFEAMLPMLKRNSLVVGDFSTALITTRILRPDISVLAIDHGQGSNRDDFVRLYGLIGIEIK